MYVNIYFNNMLIILLKIKAFKMIFGILGIIS
jgi:hypothetical protein